MSLILMAVMASGVLLSKGLLALGLRALPLRYPVAILGSYLVFLGLVRIWIAYVTIRGAGFFLGNVAGNVDSGSFGSSGSGFGGSVGESVHFGGGSSGAAAPAAPGTAILLRLLSPRRRTRRRVPGRGSPAWTLISTSATTGGWSCCCSPCW